MKANLREKSIAEAKSEQKQLESQRMVTEVLQYYAILPDSDSPRSSSAPASAPELNSFSKQQLVALCQSLIERFQEQHITEHNWQAMQAEREALREKVAAKRQALEELQAAHMQQSKYIHKVQKQLSQMDVYRSTIEMQEKVIANMQRIIEARLKGPRSGIAAASSNGGVGVGSSTMMTTASSSLADKKKTAGSSVENLRLPPIVDVSRQRGREGDVVDDDLDDKSSARSSITGSRISGLTDSSRRLSKSSLAAAVAAAAAAAATATGAPAPGKQLPPKQATPLPSPVPVKVSETEMQLSQDLDKAREEITELKSKVRTFIFTFAFHLS